MHSFRRSLMAVSGAWVFALGISAPRALLAQASGPSAGELDGSDSLPDIAIHSWRPTGCLASLAPMSMHRQPVFLAATMPPHTDSMFTLQADLIAEDVASEMHKALGSRGQDAPVADTKISWYSVPTQVVITAYRSGEMSWRARGVKGDSSANLLLTNAFDSARAHSTARIVWPDASTADSVMIRLSLVAQPPDKSDAIYPHALARVKFTAFFLSVPDESPAIPLSGQGPPEYPFENERSRVEGRLLVAMMVDSAGRVVPSTVHDVWPEGMARLDGEKGRYYNAFVRSVTKWEVQLKYTPARVGVCPVTSPVEQPLYFLSPTSAQARRKNPTPYSP